jgi:flagellar biosynthesis/type III secretory pathway chaperone
MPNSVSVQESLAALEDLLVQEFRILQVLINLTREERQLIGKKNVASLMQVVEQKESTLDQFTLMEDSRRNLAREISIGTGFTTQSYSLGELLPVLDPQTAARLGRLSEGISILANQARDLNHGNRVMATSVLEWLGTTQAFLFRSIQPEIGYHNPRAVRSLEPVFAMDIDQHI